MSQIYKFLSFIVLFSIFVAAAVWWENSNSQNDKEFISLGNTSFHTTLEPGIKEAANLGKPIFLYFRSDACYWCIKFEEEAMSDERITDILNKEFVLISIDTIKQKNIAFNLNVRNTPYMIFFNKDGGEISRIPGYIPKDEFLVKMNEVLERSKAQEVSRIK